MPRTFVHANEATAAQRRVYFDIRDATDGLTAETGEAGGQPQISTNGASWTNTGIGTLTHIGNGRYHADLTQSAVATAGDLIETRYKSANTAETPGDSIQVVAFDPADSVRLGLTALPNAAADAAGGLPISDAGGLELDTLLGQAADAGGAVSVLSSRLILVTGTAGSGTGDNTIDIGSGRGANFGVGHDIHIYGGTGIRQARRIISYSNTLGIATVDRNWTTNPNDGTSTYAILAATGPKVDTSLRVTEVDAATIRAKTDNLPSDPADQSAVEAAISTAQSALTTEINANETKLDTIAGYLDTEVAAILSAVDTEVAAIKAKTDNLPASPAAVGSAMTLEDGAITAAKVATGAIDADALAAGAVAEIQSGLATLANQTRLLGLSQDNWVWDDATYDGDGNLTAATIYAYSSAANATTHDGTTGLVAKWAFSATYSGGALAEAKNVRVS